MYAHTERTVMSFLKQKYGMEAVSTKGMDDTDFVDVGLDYSITFVGSMLVPTPSGHGSSRTETTIAKVYSEKYKIFGLKKLILTISADFIKLIENVGKERKEVANFPLANVTYCNIAMDKKYDKAFTFIVSEESSMFRAYVFHCDNVIKAKEILKKCSEAFKLHQTKLETIRLRSFSSPECKNFTNISLQMENYKQLPSDIKVTSLADCSDFQQGRPGSSSRNSDYMCRTDLSEVLNEVDFFDVGKRQRSQTDTNNANNVLFNLEFGDFVSANALHTTIQEKNTNPQINIPTKNDDDDDFTKLAEKRTRSISLPRPREKKHPGTGEGLLLLESPQTQLQISLETLMNLGGTTKNPQAQSPKENENLLQF